MDAEELKALQAPVKARLREDPAHGLLHSAAGGTVSSPGSESSEK